MSQRGKRKPVDEEEDDDECSRLRQLAQDHNICSKRRKICTSEEPLPKHLSSADGKDILKKSSTRKGRYLLHISAQFAPAVGGRLGTLANLDSRNPVLYFDFPSGRLKMVGTLLFPKAKYLLLKFGAKDVLCEDVFESMVLFAEMHWIGTAEANPSEAPLEMPAELQEAIEHAPAAGEAKADGSTPAKRQRSPAGEGASQRASQPASQRSRGGSALRSAQKPKRRAASAGDTSDEEDDIDDAAEPPLSQRQHLGRSSKTAAQRRLLEAGSDADEEGDENSERGDSGSDGDGARGSAEADTEPEDAAAADSEPDGSPEAHARPSQATPATQRSAGRKRPAASQARPADEAKPLKRQRKPAAGGGRASRKVVDSDDSAEESAEAAEVVELGSDSDAGNDDDSDWTG